MRKIALRSLCVILLFIAYFPNVNGFSQDSTAALPDVALDSTIRLNAFVQDTRTPQNRFVEFFIRLQWTGDLDRYEVHRFENPILQNLQIQGSGSANRVATISGVQTAIREYTFTLKPEAIGMGYIEPMIIKYSDLATDTEHRLTTNRIEVQIIDPLPEDGSLSWPLRGVFILVLVVSAVILVRWFRIKTARRKKAAQEMTKAVVPIEEKYLQELKKTIDLNDPSLDGAKAFAQLSKILRRFLHERFSAPGLEATTSEVIQYLYEQKFENRWVNEIKEILSNADIIKFSGKPVDRPDIERTFTIVESLFQASLQGQMGPHSETTTTVD
ncbi:hypothetical protein EH223_17670 [candidate division KSB1 bacterium]|nr:hypothetical protein [candidate division KSB1 bacterium]RQW00578.1 MAG: hypothetical protein EH223_17670 [candidate division KSB1 bacterium]